MKRIRHALPIFAALAALAITTGCTPAAAAPVDGADAFAAVSDRIDSAHVEQREAAKREFAMARWNERQEAARAVQEAAEAAAQAEAEYEAVWYDGAAYRGSYGFDYGNPFRSDGVASDENHGYGWYSQNVLPGHGLTALNENGRHVDESTGYVVDGEGYIAVAMDGVDMGSVIDTPWGQAKVYDRVEGEDAPYTGFVDVYTDF